MLLDLYTQPFLIFVFVLARISGLLMSAPYLGSRTVPMRIRGLLAVAMALVVTPTYAHVGVESPNNLLMLGTSVASEAAMGVLLGLSMQVLFAGIQLAGQVVGQMSGMSLADVFDPGFDESVSVFSRFLDLLAMAIFLMIGGHRQATSALLDLFQSSPPGQAVVNPLAISTLMELASHAFSLSIRVAAPAIISLLLSVLVMGLISRTLPQLNILAVGFSFNAIVVLASLLLSIGTITWVLESEVTAAISAMTQALGSGP